MENLLSVHDVAAIMRVHHKKVQRLARTGVLPCIKIGCVYRFQPEALKGWIDNEVSKRVPEKACEEVGSGSLGVSVQRFISDITPENPLGVRISDCGFREGRSTESSF